MTDVLATSRDGLGLALGAHIRIYIGCLDSMIRKVYGESRLRHRTRNGSYEKGQGHVAKDHGHASRNRRL